MTNNCCRPRVPFQCQLFKFLLMDKLAGTVIYGCIAYFPSLLWICNSLHKYLKSRSLLWRSCSSLIPLSTSSLSFIFKIHLWSILWTCLESVYGHNLINVNIIWNQNGWTALHWAANTDRSEIIETLLEAGVDPNIAGYVCKLIQIYPYKWSLIGNKGFPLEFCTMQNLP